ncbi:CopG family ribbon-helix-helix protein [Agrobacterium rosae]|uniref:Ribbon-helix-helix protein, CopG family n=1 Tax=Agrobacterium rosae TaxID=1972867 RepID=A0AAE5VQT9_9HYPH|nr:ribbon-helix-helix protein, CopG family [Agrobacterium rosae]KAA3512964.1 ribbon-helix-helix protein, CopG family [Agrobacterium rosae]KAA3521550.1 ribbon-helix-helix protein, CopG family [Agrobacterium rosae]MCM2432574.1 ribbon-helix-helix protein, CopG family [Agrobacterium rosae]MDX8313553.1 ribbon-helix-helix protein, CopG family [Agrobacterium rosae]MDX8328355.1 ribbon-helix-helix protein, CopG family [Agrobacterium rosae]
MKSTIQLSDDIDRRIDLVAAKSSLTRSQIVEEALAHGRSIAWQEQWVTGVKEGLDDAKNGNFASEEDIAEVLNRYDQA